MKAVAALLAVLAIGASAAAEASDGAGYVPAHRTRDGQFVPANVPPSSAGTGSSRSYRHPGTRSRKGEARSAPLAPPLLVEAQPLRR